MGEVQDNSYINDGRFANEFKSNTFSNFKKTEVKQALQDALYRGKIEDACFLSAELVCAGHFLELWESFLFYLARYIHLGHPKLAVYLENRYHIFRNILEKAVFTHEIQLRNHVNVRRLFAEVVCVLIQPSFESVKIIREEEFDTSRLHERLKAMDTSLVDAIFLSKDPPEYYIAVNEFGWALTHPYDTGGGVALANYWIEWIMDFDVICKKQGNIALCERRYKLPVASAYQRDVIWLVWDMLLHIATSRPLTSTSTSTSNGHQCIEKVLNALRNLFCIKYTTGSCKRRRYLLYFATALVTEPSVVPQLDMEMVRDKEVVETVTSQINAIYKRIKQNEQTPQTDYLFDNIELDDTEVQRSMQRLFALNFRSP